MENKSMRFLSLLLALVMVIGLIPVGHVHAEEETVTVIGEMVTVIEDNAAYVITLHGTMNALSNQQGSTGWGTHTLATVGCGKIVDANVLWTLESAEGGYKLKSGDAYLTISRNAAELNETGHVFELVYYTDAGWTIKSLETNEYGNNLANSGSIGGWLEDGTKFDLYTVAESTISEADPYGKQRGLWTKVSVDTETLNAGATEGEFEKAFDCNPATHWHSNWNGAQDVLTGENSFAGVIDFGQAYTINQFSFTPRTDVDSGQVTQASLYVTDVENPTDEDWKLVAEHATFEANREKKDINFEAQPVRCVKFVAEDAQAPAHEPDKKWVAVSEFDIAYIEAAEHEHTPAEAVRENEVAATCTEDGSYDSVIYCEECTEEISRETITVPALGHNEDEVLYTYHNTNDDMHIKIVNCTACGEEQHRFEESCTGGVATCTQVKICDFCGLSYGDTLPPHELTVPSTGTIESEGEWNHIYSWTAEQDAELVFTFAEGLDWTITRGEDFYSYDNTGLSTFNLAVFAGDVVLVNPCVYEAGNFSWSVAFAEGEEDVPVLKAELNNGDIVALTECEYTYTEDGKLVHDDIYIKLSGTSGKTPGASGDGDTATVELITDNDAVYLKFAGTTKTYYLHFYSQTTAGWDRCSNQNVNIHANGTHAVYLFKAVEENDPESRIPGYTMVNTLEQGGKYLIVGAHNNGSFYVMAPSTSGTAGDHIALLTTEEAHECVFGEWTVTTEPTCTEPGMETRSCECGETETREIRALGHTEGEAVRENEVAATCTEDGSYDSVVYCTVCEEELSREAVTVEALGHTEGEAVIENETPATCTEDGSYDSVVYCTVCKEELSRETVTVEAQGHTEGEAVREDEVAATCTEDGSYDSVVYCTVCEEELSRETVTVEALGHTEEIIPAVAADCENTGLTEGKKCSACGEVLVEQEETPALGHDYVEVGTTDPTCTEQGYTTYRCGRCTSEYHFDYTDPLGHTPGEAAKENEHAPTCTETGSYDLVIYCETCSNEISRTTVTVEALGHIEEIIPAVEATCENTGLTEGKKCSTCGEIIVAQEETPALGHTEGETVVENNVDPSCTADGSYDNVVYCTVCGEELSRETVTVEALGHTEEIIPAVAADCENTGLTEGKKCSVCGEIIVAQEETPALGHEYGEDGRCIRCGQMDPSIVTVVAEGWSGYTTWVLTSDGVLTFVPTEQQENGQTNLKNYWKVNGVLTLPWGEYADMITKVVVEEGIHDIGQMAFYALPNLVEVQLPSTIVEIRNYAFKNCTSLTTINLESVDFIREGAFYGCAALDNLEFAENVVVEEWAFSRTDYASMNP